MPTEPAATAAERAPKARVSDGGQRNNPCSTMTCQTINSIVIRWTSTSVREARHDKGLTLRKCGGSEVSEELRSGEGRGTGPSSAPRSIGADEETNKEKELQVDNQSLHLSLSGSVALRRDEDRARSAGFDNQPMLFVARSPYLAWVTHTHTQEKVCVCVRGGGCRFDDGHEAYE